MKAKLENAREILRKGLPAEVRIDKRTDGVLMLHTPFVFPDGDSYTIYFSLEDDGSFLISDKGHTIMQLSYKYDVDRLFEDAGHYKLMRQIVRSANIEMDEKAGTFFVRANADSLSQAAIRFGQALTKIYDLSFISRYKWAIEDAKLESCVQDADFKRYLDRLESREQNTEFQRTLKITLWKILGEDKVILNYHPIEARRHYAVDYRFAGKQRESIFLYGIHNERKARDVTIALAYFMRHDINFESLLVLSDENCLPPKQKAQLFDVSAETIISIGNADALKRAILKRAA